MTTVFCAKLYNRFIEIQSNLSREKFHIINQGSIFLDVTFSHRESEVPQSSLEEEQF